MVSHIDDETPDPVLDERVRSVLDALAAPTEPGPLPGEVDAVAAFRAQHRTRRSPMSHLTPFRLAVASAVGAGVFLTGGVAAAATGSLPGAAQDVARTVIGTLGIEVPAGEEAPEQAEERRTDDTDEIDETDATEVETVDAEQEDAESAENGKGEEISELATDDSTSGLENGAAVSGAASEGRSRAGQHGAPHDAGRPDTDDTTAEEGAGNAPVDAPNTGGTDTADDATTTMDDGASANGTGTAGTRSDGRSGAGSANGDRP